MKNKENRPRDVAGLRARAEESVRENARQLPEDLESLSPEEAQRIAGTVVSVKVSARKPGL